MAQKTRGTPGYGVRIHMSSTSLSSPREGWLVGEYENNVDQLHHDPEALGINVSTHLHFAYQFWAPLVNYSGFKSPIVPSRS